MLVKELLDKKVKYKIKRAESDLFKTIATIGGREIEFTADEEVGYPREWVATFSEVKKIESTEHRDYGKTGSGSELEVFSMVKDSMLEFIQTYDPMMITFTATKDADGNGNRADLYARLLQRFKIPGYSIKRRSVSTYDHKFDIFEIEKNASK